MKQRRETSLWDQSVPAITPDLPPSTAAHNELIKQNKKLRRLLNTERRRNQKIVAILVNNLDALQDTVKGLRESIVANLAAGLKPRSEQ